MMKFLMRLLFVFLISQSWAFATDYTLYNGVINLASIGKKVSQGDSSYSVDYSLPPHLGPSGTSVYRLYSGFSGTPDSIPTAMIPSNAKIVTTQFSITYSANSTKKVQIVIDTISYSSGAYTFKNAWEGLSKFQIKKEVSDWGNTISLTPDEMTTVTGWIKGGKKIYFGAIIDGETYQTENFYITNVTVKYKLQFDVSVYVDSLYDASSVVSINNLPIVGTSGVLTFDEGSNLQAVANAVVTKGSQTYAFSHMVCGSTTYNSTSVTLPVLLAPMAVYVYYKEAVKVTLKNVVSYDGYQDVDLDNSSIDVFINGSYSTNVPTPRADYLLPQNVTLAFKTQHGSDGQDNNYRSSGVVIKHETWNGDNTNYKLMSKSIVGSKSFSQTAKYTQLRNAILQVSFDGILQNNIGVQFKDPWRVASDGSGNMVQPGDWDSYNNPFTPGSGNYSAYGGVHQNIQYSTNFDWANYRIKSVSVLTDNISNFYFADWTATGATVISSANLETPVVFNNAGATVTARYKGNLRTGRPDLADAKNQRRIVSYVNCNIMVYESMGNVYLTKTDDGGITWLPEVRLNSVDGAATNPTISNVLNYGGTPYLLIAWVESVSGVSSLHFQTMQALAGYYWGWNVYPDAGQDTSNHKTLNDLRYGPSGNYAIERLRSDARPVVYLTQVGAAIRSYFAFEGTNGSVNVGYLTTPTPGSGLGRSYIDQGLIGYILKTAAGYPTYYPVIITYPASYGYPAHTYVFYLADGYATGGRRVAAYDYDTRSTTLLSNPNNDYTYYSLQGAVSPANGLYGLVASSVCYDNYTTTYRVNLYNHPTYYGNSLPYPSVMATLMNQPTVMCEQSSGFGSSWNGAVVMKNMTDGNFYQMVGGTLSQINTGGSVGGVFAKGEVSPGDRSSMLVKTTTTPATIVKYTGSGLAKVGDAITTNRHLVRILTDENEMVRRIALDVSKADVEVVDSLELGSDVCVLKINKWGQSIIRQVDSLRAPLAVKVKRDGKTIKSFNASSWESLTSANLKDVSEGDIITISAIGMKKTGGFMEVSLPTNSLLKEEIRAEALIPTEKNINVFPNPFNPATTFRVSLPHDGNICLNVYNMLGQKVATIFNGAMQAGYNDIRFDGSHLASGVYFYRVEMDNFVKSGKLFLMK